MNTIYVKQSSQFCFVFVFCQIEAVYYFVVGDVPADTKQLLLGKVSDGPCPVNAVSFNAREDETVIFLKELSRLASGRYDKEGAV